MPELETGKKFLTSIEWGSIVDSILKRWEVASNCSLKNANCLLYTSGALASKLLVCKIEGHANPYSLQGAAFCTGSQTDYIPAKKCIFAFRGCDVIIHGSAAFKQWLKRRMNEDPREKSTCCVCWESKRGMEACGVCSKWLCLECHEQLAKVHECPHCRSLHGMPPRH